MIGAFRLGVIAAAVRSAVAAPATVQQRASGATSIVDAVTSVSVTAPAGVLAGDLLVASVMHRSALTTPAGWTLLQTSAAATNSTGFSQYTSMLLRTAAGSDAGASFSFVQASAGRMNGHILALYSSAGTPVADQWTTAVESNDATPASTAGPSLTVTGSGKAVVVAISSILAQTGGPATTLSFDAPFSLVSTAAAVDNRLGVGLGASAAVGSTPAAFSVGVPTGSDNGFAKCIATFAAPTSDPFFSSVVLLCHFDGAEAAATFTDSSSFARALSVTGNSKVSTTSPKFGSGAVIFDGSTDMVSAAHSSDFDMGAGDFTIEFFALATANGGAGLISKRASTGVFAPFNFTIDASRVVAAQVAVTGTAGWAVQLSSTAIPLNTWTHFALVRSGNTISLYKDGVLATSGTVTAGAAVITNTAGVSIGAGSMATESTFFGKMDELRITKGVARYVANFTPPTAAFPNTGPSPAFSYTGADQSYIVPAGVTSITVRAWGGGGGSSGARSSDGDRAFGGPGGFVKATVPVTPGETLTIKVGGGGQCGTPGTGNRYAGAGGGRSEILRGSTPLVIAGGGGGAGGFGNSWASNWGGLGGGTTGGVGGGGTAGGGSNGGGGGTQSAGGAAGTPTDGVVAQTAGASKQGGYGGGSTAVVAAGGWPNGGNASRAAQERGGGGGDGYFGGGGGGGSGTWGNGGGGGSSYTDASCTNVTHTQGTNTANTGSAAPATGESGYVAGVALGGLNDANGGVNGGNGRVVISTT